MFAVLKDNIVVDCAFLVNGIYGAPMSKKIYEEKDGFSFIEMTIENTPAFLGSIYDKINNKFMEVIYA